MEPSIDFRGISTSDRTLDFIEEDYIKRLADLEAFEQDVRTPPATPLSAGGRRNNGPRVGGRN